MLELHGYILAGIQNFQPRFGIIIFGQEFKTITVKFNSNIRNIRDTLRRVQDVQLGLKPSLILNKHCHICEFQKYCLEIASEEDNLSLLRGISEKQINKYNNRGIFTISQLSHTYRARKKYPFNKTPHHDFALQALALRDKRVFITALPTLEHKPVRIFLDIEGIPDRSFNYLIGALVCTENSEEQFSFWANSPSEEIIILNDFLQLVEKQNQFQVFHYGAYDVNFLKHMREKTELNEIIDKILQNSTNILSIIYGNIYFPVYSNSLKHIAPLLGFAWSDTHPSGINSIIWRNEWEKTKNPADKNRLIAYNNDDCSALKVVTDFVCLIENIDNKTQTGDSHDICDQQVSYLENNLKQTYSHPDWRTPQFTIDDLDYINRCAYFDYQREKVYVRSNKNIAKQQAKKSKHRKWIKPTKLVEIVCSSCPFCGDAALTKCLRGPRHRKCLDLKITKKCVKRVVTDHAAYQYRCEKCGNVFFPEPYMKVFKYGHSLKSYAMYEYVAHRATFKGLEGTFRDLFQLPVCLRHIHAIKRIMANYYQKTIEGITKRLASGSILHADETSLKLQRGGKGYIWVFTNLEEVLYIFRPSRDGGFLSPMFEGFSGVLISDFYAAYDWRQCEQQKCLVHLMRDLNNDLLKNPFDLEYKELVTNFASVLRKIVTTIDSYGLKRRNLTKHQKEVDKFFLTLEGRYYGSRIAKGAQERFLRNKDSLFTFIKFDGVPWNNNNAEHAIKQFAHYREIVNGHVTEDGIADYLVLLSVYQTCKCKDLNFLQFLLSGEIDLWNFREKTTKRPLSLNSEPSLLEQAFFNKNLRSKQSQNHDN